MITLPIPRRWSALIATAAVTLVAAGAFAADGAEIYKGKCASCHGGDGKADSTVAKAMGVPALTTAEVQGMSAEEIARRTKEADKHPAPLKSLSDEDAAAVAGFVKGLGGGQ